MSGRILVTPEEVRAVAAQFHEGSQQTSDLVKAISTAVENLHSHWEGASSTKFYAEYTDWKQSMQLYTTHLQEIHAELMQIADRFEQADKA